MSAHEISIRSRHADDWPDIYEIFSFESVCREATSLPYPEPDRLRTQVAEPPEGVHYLVAEVVRPDGSRVVAGQLSLQTFPSRMRRKHTGALSLAVHPHYQEQGIGAALVRAALDFADNWLGLRRLYVEVFTDTALSISLYEEVGFAREATLRRYALRDGAFADAYILARINARLGGRRKADDEDPVPLRPRPAARPEVTVRGSKADDWEDLSEVFRAPSVYFNTMQLPFPAPDFIRQRHANPPKNFFNLVAEVEGRAVGSLGLHLFEGRRAHVAGLGMMIHPDYQGVGVGSALIQAGVDLAANWLQIRRLELEVYPDNAPAIALYKKFGFAHEGRYRDFSFQNGLYIDALVMARLFD
ncbi:MAG: GNAT family N-acetyltransferase [Anaerolineae bacterium]|nr:GNAT family N-acetyltransferase [Anaerolineae bacterium]